MRSILGALLLGTVIALAGCLSHHSQVKVTFLNGTDTLLCDRYYTGTVPEPAACAGRAGEAIKPHERRTRLPGCGYGASDEAFDLTIVVIVASDGREIYKKTANCKEWNDAHATFIIKQRGDGFVITDSLPDTPSR